MRLDDLDPNDINVDDQRGSGGRLGGGLGGMLPIGGGRMGFGTLIVLVIAAWIFGINPMQLLGGMEGGEVAPSSQVQGGGNAAESCTVDAFSKESCQALAMLNKTWEPLFAQANIPFKRPTLHFYSQSGRSGCGAAQSAMGPFYCPADQGIYLDTDFYNQMQQQLGAEGQFARLYVIAHEYGHHIQNQLGTSDQVRQLQERNPSQQNALSVKLELQADCYAGVWAGRNRDKLEAGDMESGLKAAHQIGDDVLLKNAGRDADESAFTHGSAAQRMKWLKTGLESGNEDSCDTFARQ